MRVSAETGDFVELERSGEPDVSGDLRIWVRLQRGGFTASIDVWVERAAWVDFARELTILEERRQGEARLEAMSPGELELTFRSLDRAGHMGVEGLVGTRRHDVACTLRFSAFSFDPSQLPMLVRGTCAISETDI